MVQYKCKFCGIYFINPNYRPSVVRVFCTPLCQSLESRKIRKMNHRRKHTSGYILAYDRNHPNKYKSGNMILEHRLIASKKIGRPLTDKEQVHHINHDKTDNRPENLMVVSSLEHMRIERGWQKTEDGWLKPCNFCNSLLPLEGNFYKRNTGGYVSYCKNCSRKHDKQRRRKVV